MSTPVEKIGIGLDKLEAQKSGRKTNLAALKAAPKNISDIKTLASELAAKRDRLRTIADATTDAIRKYREQRTAEWKDRGIVENDSGVGHIDTLGENRRRSMIDGEVRKFSRQQIAKTESERVALTADLQAAKANLDLVRDHYSSPTTMLMRQTLASERRAVFAQNLANAGPVELDAAFREAVITGNAALAAACCVRFDSLGKEPKKLVRFRKSDVAEVLACETWAEAQESIGLCDYAIAQGELASKEATGAKIDSNEKIRVGMMTKQLEAKLGRPIGEAANDDDDGVREGESFDDYLDRKYPALKNLDIGSEFANEGSANDA